jgi:hypothetical protein
MWVVDLLLWPCRYCTLLLDSDITEPALLALSVEILLEKGGIPVGEVGKLLQVRVNCAMVAFSLVFLPV